MEVAQIRADTKEEVEAVQAVVVLHVLEEQEDTYHQEQVHHLQDLELVEVQARLEHLHQPEAEDLRLEEQDALHMLDEVVSVVQVVEDSVGGAEEEVLGVVVGLVADEVEECVEWESTSIQPSL
jgi:hypothetical protein